MPATKFSVLESTPATDLRPGETGIRLKDDPYYGKVDVGPAAVTDETDKEWEKKEHARISQLPADQKPAADEKLTKELAARKVKREGQVDPKAMKPGEAAPELVAKVEALQASIEEGAHALDGDEQGHVEVITGKRLQQRAATEPPRPSAELPPETDRPTVTPVGATPVGGGGKTEAKIPTRA